MWRAHPTAMVHSTAGPPSNGWPMRQKSAGWRACCMQPTDLRCRWMADGWLSSRHHHGVPVPWLPVSRSRLSQVRGRLAPSYCPGEAGAHRKRWRPSEGHLWLHARDHLGVWVGGPQALRPQQSGCGRSLHWCPAADNGWLPFAGPWDWNAGASAGHTWGLCLQPCPGGHPCTQGAEGQVLGPTTHLQIRRGIQGGCWTVYGSVPQGCWCGILALCVPDW